MSGLVKTQPAPACRLLLVDDHQLMREGLKLLFNQAQGCDVVGEAADGQNALQQIERLQPDVVVLDIGLPDVDGIDLAQEILRQLPTTRVVILSAQGDQELLDRALEAGVAGYVLKANASAQLLEAIRLVWAGNTYLSPELSNLMISNYRRLRATSQEPARNELSDRERQVLTLIAEGRNTKEIADHFDLSVKTIESHRIKIMQKLAVQSVAELTKCAIRLGLTSV